MIQLAVPGPRPARPSDVPRRPNYGAHLPANSDCRAHPIAQPATILLPRVTPEKPSICVVSNNLFPTQSQTEHRTAHPNHTVSAFLISSSCLLDYGNNRVYPLERRPTLSPLMLLGRRSR